MPISGDRPMAASLPRVHVAGSSPIVRASPWLGSLRGWRRGTAAAVLGALAGLALPPLFALPVLLLCFPALLRLIGTSRSARGAAGSGFWFGFGLNVVGLYWITDAILFQAARFWWLVPLAVPGLSAVLAVFVALPCALARLARPGWARVLTLAGAWVLADLARQFVLTGFPWNPLGSVWELPGPPGDAMIQLAALVGVHGLTLLTVLLACAPAFGRSGWGIAAAALAAWVGFGAARLSLAPLQAGPDDLAVALAQGDIAEKHKWDRSQAVADFEHYLSLTRAAAVELFQHYPGLRPVIIWPETASPFLLTTDANARAAVAEAAGSAVTVLAGTVRFDSAGRPRNSLVALQSAAPPLAVYDKWHLVPFGEYQPTWARIGIQLVPGDGFHPGPGPRTMHVSGLPAIGPLICYEAIFSGDVVDASDRPAVMVNVTNDAWFGNSTGPRQHLAAARMRAVEEGMPLLRAANTGISAGFDRYGRELGRLGLDTGGVLVLRVHPNVEPPTLYARLGLAVPALLAAAVLTLGLTRGRTRRAR